MEEKLDCLKNCNGVCCREDMITAVPFRARLWENRVVWEVRGVTIKKGAGGRLEFWSQPCKNLNLETGRCSIYPDRPEPCRKAVVGDFECRRMRRIHYHEKKAASTV